MLDPSGPERANGNSNHGPIATEGAFQVKSPEAMLPWIESYVTCQPKSSLDSSGQPEELDYFCTHGCGSERPSGIDRLSTGS